MADSLHLSRCPAEANYAYQQELDMVPLMMQKDYSPKGWLGMILGTRMWYALWDAETDDDTAFDRRLDSVVREIGDRGKLMMAEAVPPEPTPAPAPAPQRSYAPAAAAVLRPIWGNGGNLRLGWNDRPGIPGVCDQGDTYSGSPDQICGGANNWGETRVVVWRRAP
eukprot:COSAG06_NODE_344_length_17074_cov_116.626510_19_plen_166_part_00